MDAVFRAARRLLRDEGKAADAVQETYLLAWKKFSSYQAGTNCRAWLFQILFNIVRHERRSWFHWITAKEEDVASVDIPAPEAIPDTITDQEILKALDNLQPAYREVLVLVDVEEFSYKEAAGILGVPTGTVMSRLSRARTQLRDQLRDTARSWGIGAG
jgi:RNA polymerase sigma-70 factor (ECF subfamily)